MAPPTGRRQHPVYSTPEMRKVYAALQRMHGGAFTRMVNSVLRKYHRLLQMEAEGYRLVAVKEGCDPLEIDLMLGG